MFNIDMSDFDKMRDKVRTLGRKGLAGTPEGRRALRKYGLKQISSDEYGFASTSEEPDDPEKAERLLEEKLSNALTEAIKYL